MREIIKQYYLTNKARCISNREVAIASELANILGAKTEVTAPFGLGRIDIMSTNWLIECKNSGNTNEKNAIGQLLVYSHAFNFKGNLGLGIIGDYPKPGIRRFCQLTKITVFHYNLNTRKWSVLDEHI